MENFNFYCINPPTAVYELHYNRASKTDYEKLCLQEANHLAAKAHLAARDAFYDGASEYEINIAYLQSLLSLEHEMPYSNIVAINENASTLHYTKLQRNRLERTKLRSFLIDAGANFNNYAADITRTYAYDTKSEFAEMIDHMNVEQLKLVDLLRVGTSYIDVQLAAHQMTARILEKFDFIKLSAEEIVNEAMTRYFFPHGIGHLLGIQVHDVGGYQQDKQGKMKEPPKENPFLRSTKMIEEGHVYTIEPGFYFIDMLLKELKAHKKAASVNWSKIDVFRSYGGIRIEDDVCVSESGNINFTRIAFRALGVKDAV
jgi:Xaa-Pro dipeptidase